MTSGRNIMKFRNLTRLLFLLLMAGLVSVGPAANLFDLAGGTGFLGVTAQTTCPSPPFCSMPTCTAAAICPGADWVNLDPVTEGRQRLALQTGTDPSGETFTGTFGFETGPTGPGCPPLGLGSFGVSVGSNGDSFIRL